MKLSDLFRNACFRGYGSLLFTVLGFVLWLAVAQVVRMDPAKGWLPVLLGI